MACTTGHDEARVSEVVWIDDEAYDVSDYARWHPGGDNLEPFVGRDATTVFYATHSPAAHRWLKARRVDRKDAPVKPACNEALRAAYKELHGSFARRGWLTPSLEPLLKNLALSAAFFLLALACPWDGSGRLPHTVLGMFLGMAFHQLAFSVHDLMHGSVLKAKASARWLGYLLGDLGFGVLSGHWDDEHIAHHAMSNCIDLDLQQRNAPIITVDRKQLTEKKEKLTPPAFIERWLLRVNHWFWLPAATWGGRFALQAVSVQWALERPRERAWQVALLVLHYAWLTQLLSSRAQAFPVIGGVALGPWFAGLVTYLVTGLLHIQLLMNHASRPMTSEKDDTRASSVDWVTWQAEATADIGCPRWMDWFHGGLQFQITHHLFPRLRADRLREASMEVYAMLRKHEQPVEIYDGFSGGVAAVTRQLASACEDAGYKPWYLGAKDIQTPNVVALAVHFGLLVVLPFAVSSDGVYVAAWAAWVAFVVGALLLPLTGLV